MKMWNLFVALTFTTLTASADMDTTNPSTVNLATKIDSDITLMFNTILTSILKKAPGASEGTQVSMLPESDLTNGLIQANFVFSADAAGTPQTQGTLSVQMVKDGNSNVSLNVSTLVSMPKDGFILNLQNIINGILADKQISSPVAISDLASFKSELLRILDSFQPATQKKRQTFGRPSAGNSSELSADKIDFLKALLESSLLIETTAAGQILKVDVSQIQNNSSALEEISSVFSKLQSLQGLQVELNETSALLSISSLHSVPQNTIEVYDSYLSQQQNSSTGLQSLSQLIQKLGPWVVGRCANAEYQNICIEKLIYSCAKNTDRVANCVADAESIQRARDARAQGDTLGAIANTTDALINSTGQKIEDQVDDLINWATGNDEDSSGQGE